MSAMLAGAAAAADVKAAVRQAMLQHELVFRSQVRELHRLYWTQKNLMRAAALEAAAAQTVIGEAAGSGGEQRERRMSLDLRLAPEEYVTDGGGGPVSTGIGVGLNRGLKDSSNDMLHIDLNMDQNDEPFSHLNNTTTFLSPATSSSVQHGSLWSEPSKLCSKETITCQPEYINRSSGVSGGKIANWLFNACQDSHLRNNQASAESNKVTENSWKHQPEFIEVHQSDPTGREKTYGITTGELEAQTSLNGIIPSSRGSCQIGEENADSSSEQLHSYLHTDSRKQASAVTFSGGFDCNNRHTSVGSTNLLAALTTDSDGKQANCNGSEVDTLSSHTVPLDKGQVGEHNVEFPDAKIATQATGNSDWSAVRKRHGMLSASEDSGTTQLNSSDCYPSKHAPSADSDYVCLLDELYCSEKLEPQVHLAQDPDMNSTMTAAAELLVSLSAEKTFCSPNRLASIEQTETEDDQPQYSSDSYESITLKLTETRDDRFTISPTSTEEATLRDACGVKLRRGSRLRDFQKDILPGLASLSRHEICEDLQMIGYEHKRNRTSRQQRDVWSVPVKRRRSARKPAVRRR